MAVSMIGPKFYAWDRDGKPLAFGKVYTYKARTNAPKATYQSEDGIVENTNPVILNGEGYGDIYLDGSYKIVVKDKDDNEIWTEDPVTAQGGEEWVNCHAVTYLTASSFKVAGNVTDKYEVGRRVRIDNGAPTFSYSAIKSAVFAASETTIEVTESIVSVGIESVCVSIIGSESIPSVSDAATFSGLRAIEPINDGDQINLLGHTVAGLGGGVFYHDASSGSSDNNGTVAVTAGGKRWLRKESFPVDPVMFGALINGSDSYTAIAAAIAAANDSGIVYTKPLSFGQKITGIAPWIQKEGAKLTYVGAPIDDAVIEIGVESVTTNTKTCVFDVSSTSIDWSLTNYTGLRLVNFANCNITYREIFGFTIGIQELGFNNGFAYNTITAGILISNKTQMEWATKGAAAPQGYHNENLYYGGRFTNFSSSPTGVQRIGVRSHSIDGVYTNNNNNVWLKPSFELFDGGLPVSMEAGTQNEFLYFRNESNGPVFVSESGTVSENLYIEGYSDQFDVAAKLTTTSLYRDSVYIPSRTKVKDHAVPFFESGNLRDLSNYYSFSRINTRHVQLFEGAGGVTTPVNLISNFTLNEDSLELSATTKGVGISVDTRKCRRFGVRPNCVQAGGRITVVCYDSAGAQITPINGSTLFTMKGRTFPAETIFFGGYRFGVDIGADDDQWYQFTLDDTVDSIDVIFAAGSAPLDMRSFDLYHMASDDDAVPVSYLKTCKEVNLATAKPTQGVHKLCDSIDNAVPAVGQPQGWVCITAGDFAGTPPVYASKPNLLA
tara:strand:+ start:29150 stop:31480 length:2331 start_codon:yes stop_codon:yes gene_type:complete